MWFHIYRKYPSDGTALTQPSTSPPSHVRHAKETTKEKKQTKKKRRQTHCGAFSSQRFLFFFHPQKSSLSPVRGGGGWGEGVSAWQITKAETGMAFFSSFLFKERRLRSKPVNIVPLCATSGLTAQSHACSEVAAATVSASHYMWVDASYAGSRRSHFRVLPRLFWLRRRRLFFFFVCFRISYLSNQVWATSGGSLRWAALCHTIGSKYAALNVAGQIVRLMCED